jgi:hypothetical protein
MLHTYLTRVSCRSARPESLSIHRLSGDTYADTTMRSV